MATVSGVGTWKQKRVHKQTWTGLTTGDVGSPFTGAGLADKTIQVLGTIGGSPAFAIQGSNDDGVTWATLKDSQGNLLDQSNVQFDGAGESEVILENPLWIRPIVTTGTSITFIIISSAAP